MPNRLAWTLTTAALVALGIVTAPDEHVSPTVNPRKVHKTHVASVGPDEGGPVDPTPEETLIDLTYIAIPTGIFLPKSERGEVFLPFDNVRLLVVTKTAGNYLLSKEPPMSKIARGAMPTSPATDEVAPADLEDALKRVADEVKNAQLILVADASVTWRPRLDAVLSAASAAGFGAVLLAVEAPDESPGIRTLKYLTYVDEEGTRTGVLPGRDDEPLDGGVVRVDLVGGEPMFRFASEQSKSAVGLADTIGAYHAEYLETADGGRRYADAGRAWTVRPAAVVPWRAVVEALTLIRAAGVSRVGIEWPQ